MNVVFPQDLIGSMRDHTKAAFTLRQATNLYGLENIQTMILEVELGYTRLKVFRYSLATKRFVSIQFLVSCSTVHREQVSPLCFRP